MSDVVIVGGCGHVGLPLGIALADTGLRVTLYDRDEAAVASVRRGALPFTEPGAQEPLDRVLAAGNLDATTQPDVIATAETVIVVIGTPIDEHLNPQLHAVPEAIRAVREHLRDGQLLVLRSTVYPGVTALVESRLRDCAIDVAFCPERIAEGKAMVELHTLPQIIGARTESARKRAEQLFRRMTEQVVHLSPEEAEVAKLLTNSWRYLKFAIANQFFMIANDFGLDYSRIRDAIVFEYPRAADLPRAGFAAGPCLLKDTMQLAAFNNNNFTLGHVAMTVNEGLPLYLVSRMQQRYDLSRLCVGILGMAFKGGSDDTRSSLSYKLKRILRFRAADVVTTDPYVTTDPDLVPLEDVVTRADLLVIGAPHPDYAGLAVSTPVVDVWGITGADTVI